MEGAHLRHINELDRLCMKYIVGHHRHVTMAPTTTRLMTTAHTTPRHLGSKAFLSTGMVIMVLPSTVNKALLTMSVLNMAARATLIRLRMGTLSLVAPLHTALLSMVLQSTRRVTTMHGSHQTAAMGASRQSQAFEMDHPRFLQAR